MLLELGIPSVSGEYWLTVSSAVHLASLIYASVG